MSRLLSAGFFRVFKKKTFYICSAIMAANALLCVIDNVNQDSHFYLTLDDHFFEYVQIIPILISVFCAMFIGTEYSNGTMRNKIAAGHKRSAIYLSNLIVSAASGLLMCAAYFVLYLAAGIPLLGLLQGDIGRIMALVGCSLAMLLAATGIFTLISLTVRSKSASAVISIIVAFVMLFSGAALYTLLKQPEYNLNYVYEDPSVEFDDSFHIIQFDIERNSPDDNETEVLPEIKSEYVPNPLYVSGVKRQIFQFIVDFTPGGQVILINSRDVESPLLLVGYSLIIVIVTTAAGLIKFNRMNLN